MKYCVVIMDGAAGWPLPERGNQTCLELARKPNLDRLAREGRNGLVRTVPAGMEPSSAIACMSVLGYDPKVYYGGRSGIEARSLGIPLEKGDVTFRCNLVAVKDGVMWSYGSGNIASAESHELIKAVQAGLDNDRLRFYPGVDYRHILVIKNGADAVKAACTPPHDISDKPIAGYLPKGPGSELLRDLMERSRDILRNHPVNHARRERGDIPATMIWLFWPSGEIPELPPFPQRFGIRGAMTSAVDLLNGLAGMTGLTVLKVPGATAGMDNDWAGQARAALEALKTHDLVVVHIEAPDEAGHAGSVAEKAAAIEKIDAEVIARLAAVPDVRIMVTPDHPTPIKIKTHCDDPVPFLLWGTGFAKNGAAAYSEKDAAGTGLVIPQGHALMPLLTGGSR